jgi:hypothetical protein
MKFKKCIDFYISNPNHHWAMFKPVIKEMLTRGYEVRLLSLCELRRMRSPEVEQLGIQLIKLFPFMFRGLSASAGNKGIGGNQAMVRSVLRFFLWIFIIKFILVRALRNRPHIAIVPNDVAYPFDHICKILKGRGIKFLLLQEGIRFPLPNENGRIPYGNNNPTAVMAWGLKSAEYFRQFGLQTEITGCPRYDDSFSCSYTLEVDKIKSTISLGSFNILFASNPIDDQGFCSLNEKLNLFRKFLLFAFKYFQKDTIILLRLHPRENPDDFLQVIRELNVLEKVQLVSDFPLFALFKCVQLTVIFASTIGLEALMHGSQLCVIKLPHHGYVFDYVSSGVALPLDLDNTSEFKFISRSIEQRNAYWQSYVAYPGESSRRTADIIEKFL